MLPISSANSIDHNRFSRSNSIKSDDSLGRTNSSRSEGAQSNSGYDGSRSSFEAERSRSFSFDRPLEGVVVATPNSVNSPNTTALSQMLTSIFTPHINAENREEVKTIIHDRSVQLNDMGETPTSVDAVLAKGQRLDRLSSFASGMATSVPFGVASRLTDTVPAITALAATPAQVGAIAGVFAGVVDTVGTKALEKATSNILWLSAKDEELEPVMSEASKERQPSDSKKALEVGLSYQTYSLRNIARIGASALTAATSTPKTTAEVDSWMAAIGSPISGGGARLGVHSFNEANRRVGPSYLLGRKDWKEAFVALKEAPPVKTPLVNGAKRLANAPVDAVIAGGENIKELLSYKSIVRNVGMLGAGFSGILQSKASVSQLASQANLSKAAVAAIGQSIMTATMVPVIVAWTSSDTLSHHAMKKIKDAATNAKNSFKTKPITPSNSFKEVDEELGYASSPESYHTANETFSSYLGGEDRADEIHIDMPPVDALHK